MAKKIVRKKGINIRVSDKEHAHFLRVARDSGMTLSAYLRHMIEFAMAARVKP